MKKILVPVDFSGHTEIICTYALELAGEDGAEIRLFHTYSDQLIIADSSFPDSIDMSTIYNEELLKEVFHEAEKKMECLKSLISEKIKKSGKEILLDITLVGGSMESELAELCKNYTPDLVVMGMRGTGKTIRQWGRVSTYIISHARVPVLTVPEINKYRGFGKIMLSADLSDNNSILVQTLLDSFRRFGSHLSCVHFSARGHKQDDKARLDSLRKNFLQEEESGLVSFEILPLGKDHMEAINTYLEENNIDIIAFKPHRHSFFYHLSNRTVTRKDLVATKIPLLALPQRRNNLL